jgi:Transposase DDE domain
VSFAQSKLKNKGSPAEMKNNVYKQVESSLKKVYPPNLQGYAQRRFNHLVAYVSSLIDKNRSSMSQLGSNIPTDIQAASREKQAKRFLEDKNTTYKAHYLPFLSVFLKNQLSGIRKATGIRIAIDGTVVNAGYVGLMASLVVGTRSIPLVWLLKAGKKGHFEVSMHVELIHLLAETFQFTDSSPVEVTILGDGEFDSIVLQALCDAGYGWKYVFRTSSDTLLYDSKDKLHARDVQKDSEEEFVFLPNIEFTGKKYGKVHFLYWHEQKKYDKPIYLVSNWKDPQKIMTYYKERFSIETMFKDFKSNGFNMHLSRLKKEHSLTNLLLLVCIAFCLMMNLGARNQTMEESFQKKIQRTRKDGKTPFSLFSFAKNLVDYCKKWELNLCFDLEPAETGF